MRCSCASKPSIPSIRRFSMHVIERVLAVEPRHLFALLQKATLLESQGKTRAAAKVYHHALQTIPPGTSVPGALRGVRLARAARSRDCGRARGVRARLRRGCREPRAAGASSTCGATASRRGAPATLPAHRAIDREPAAARYRRLRTDRLLLDSRRKVAHSRAHRRDQHRAQPECSTIRSSTRRGTTAKCHARSSSSMSGTRI